MESYRTERGPRQRVVAWLGAMDDEAQRLGVKQAATHESVQGAFGQPEPRYVEIAPSSISVSGVVDLGGVWIGLEMAKRLGLPAFLESLMPAGEEDVPWPLMSLVLVLGRLTEPSSELYLAEHLYSRTAMEALLGVRADKVNDDRLYRALDRLLPHKEALEVHIKEKLGSLFNLDYDLLLYDMTSTYFEGQCEKNPQAKRGYSRDHRGDCKQVCIALVVSRCGMPIGYEVFDGNRADVTTVEEIIEAMESRHGKAKRVWAMDRGMMSQENVEFLQEGDRQYILGCAKGMLKKHQQKLLEEDWEKVHAGLEVKCVESPEGPETFILCRSADRGQKEKAMHQKFMDRITKGLEAVDKACRKKKQDPLKIAGRVGRLLGKNTRAQGAFDVKVAAGPDGGACVSWTINQAWMDWSSLSEGCYMLRTNIKDWTGQDLWKAYTQLTEAEEAFRIQKSDLSLRPVWHQKQERVQAHILVCFLAYVLWKTLGQTCLRAGLGHEPRKVLDEINGIKMAKVTMRTKAGTKLVKRCVTKPTDHQAILLHKLGMALPTYLETLEEIQAV